MRYALAVVLVLVTTSVSSARELRDGANHHLGDDSFVARFGRTPAPADTEALRMHVHLAYVRELLGSRAATAPVLASRRAELLGYLDEYIAAGITPKNSYVPWRSPVFIDATDHICAVGYLIERSVGRELPEAIAAAHRLDYLEDIAAAMPEVGAWVTASGLTLEELASIQPGYEGPPVQHLEGWMTAEIENGVYHEEKSGVVIDGRFARKQMVGTWKVKTSADQLIGSGTFRNGAGTWRSVRLDGSKMAEGPFVRSHAEGEWRFFHPSGRLAAIGPMHEGKRAGTWTFFHDAKGQPKLATGRFEDGEVASGWKHYDASGRLVATASGRAWKGGLTLRIEPGADGVGRAITQGEPATRNRLDAFVLGKDRIYIRDRLEMFDAAGNQLEKVGGVWMARACNWTARRKRAAAAGDNLTMFQSAIHEEYQFDDPDPKTSCIAEPTRVAAASAKHYDTMLASRTQLRTPIPVTTFQDPMAEVNDEVAEVATPATEAEPEIEMDAHGWEPIPEDNPADLATYLADHMTWYMEWPYVDDAFIAVFHSMPGYAKSGY